MNMNKEFECKEMPTKRLGFAAVYLEDHGDLVTGVIIKVTILIITYNPT